MNQLGWIIDDGVMLSDVGDNYVLCLDIDRAKRVMQYLPEYINNYNEDKPYFYVTIPKEKK